MPGPCSVLSPKAQWEEKLFKNQSSPFKGFKAESAHYTRSHIDALLCGVAEFQPRCPQIARATQVPIVQYGPAGCKECLKMIFIVWTLNKN